MPFLPIPPYTNSANPITNITPFTYGDGYTYLSLLEDMRVYLNTMIESVNSNTDSANDVVGQFSELVTHVNDAIDNYSTQLNDWETDFNRDYSVDYLTMRADMITLIKTSSATGVCFNPTRGKYSPFNQTINDIYDFLRIRALSAAEYDALEFTDDMFSLRWSSAYDYDVTNTIGKS